MKTTFNPQFDRVGLSLSIMAMLILLYFALLNPLFFREYWVAYAFFMAGFFGTLALGLAKRTTVFSFMTFAMIALGLISIAMVNYAYASLVEQEIMITDRIFGFAIGVSEELFFGVFLLGILINWLGLNRFLAIIISSVSHSIYHIPNWGQDPRLMALFFTCFLIARSLYVFVWPRVGMLLGTHGFWNALAGG